MHKIKRLTLLFIFLLLAASSSGCATLRGAGEDLCALGRGTADAAEGLAGAGASAVKAAGEFDAWFQEHAW